MPRLSWRWLLALSSVPSFGQLFFYVLVPESPRYLCSRGSYNEAQQILEKMALHNQTETPHGILVSDSHDQESAPTEDYHLLPSRTKNLTESKLSFSYFFMLFSPNLIRTTLLLWGLYLGISFSYYGIILLTSQLSSGQSGCNFIMFNSLNLEDASLYVDVFITSLAGTVSSFCIGECVENCCIIFSL